MSDTHNHNHNHSHKLGDSREELLALVNYMVNHNISHTNELESIAKELAATADEKALAEINEAISFYKKGNDCLSNALENLK